MNRFFEVEANEVVAVPREVAHFLGYPYGTEPEKDAANLIESAISEMQPVLRPKLVFEEFECKVTLVPEVSTRSLRLSKGRSFERVLEGLEVTGASSASATGLVRIADFELKSESLSKNLSGCEKVVMFAATVGSDVDKLIRKYQKIDTVKASVMQATGAMFIESFVDAFNEKVKNETESTGGKTKPRFSPGYGDVPLDVQKLFFNYLDCKKIGLTLMDTLIMAPEKSVTAFVGIC